MVGNLAGILLIVMMIMVNLTIFSRWVFNINMHGYEELPTILFIVFVWLGVILVVRDDNMLKVDFFLNLCRTARAKEIFTSDQPDYIDCHLRYVYTVGF